MASSSTANGPGPPSDSAPGGESVGGEPMSVGAMSTAGESSATVQVDQGQRQCCGCHATPHHRKLVAGVALMVVGAVCWVGTTQAARRTYQRPNYYAPFFLVYFCTSWLLIFYPLYLAIRFACAKGKIALGETFRLDTS